jgi:hypothetical protein
VKKKYPDNIVYNVDTGKFDANLKNYPTTVGSQKFDPIVVDKSEGIKADKFFNSRLTELKKEYELLVSKYVDTKLVYDSDYNFQPIVGETYHLYEKEDGNNFLSIISPKEWDKKYVGSYVLLNNGTWEKL